MLVQGEPIRHDHQHRRDGEPETQAIPHPRPFGRAAERLGPFDRPLGAALPAEQGGHHHQDEEARAGEEHHAAQGRERGESFPRLRDRRPAEVGGVDPPRYSHQAGDVIGEGEEAHPQEPEIGLHLGERDRLEPPSAHLGHQPVHPTHERERGSAPDRQVEVGLDPGGVVHHRVEGIGRVHRAPESADQEEQHRQEPRRHRRVAPGEFPDPAEEPLSAAQPAGHLERGADGECRQEAREADDHRQQRVQQLPLGGDAGILELVMQPDGGGDHHEHREHHPAQRVREELAPGLLRQHGVPEGVGRQDPEVHQRVPGEPEEHPGQEWVDGGHPSHRPGDEQKKHFGGDAEGTKEPEDGIGGGRVHRQAHGPVTVPAPALAPGEDHLDGPPPGSHDHEGESDVERGRRLHRRIEGVQDAGLHREDRNGGHHQSHHRRGPADPGQARRPEGPQLLLGGGVAQAHDEKGREDERHQHPVCRHRHVVHPCRAVRDLEVGTADGLHHRHRGSHTEGEDRHPEVGEDDPALREELGLSGHGILPRCRWSRPGPSPAPATGRRAPRGASRTSCDGLCRNTHCRPQGIPPHRTWW